MKTFKYFIQKVLPAVYDDTLSYYELLSKIIEKLNECIKGQNTLSDDFKELYDFVNTYFDNLDLNEIVSIVLDEMLINGTLEDIIDRQILDSVKAKTKNNYIDVTNFGADNTGKKDSIGSLILAHNEANELGLPVIYPKGKYLIASNGLITVKTSVDFRDSEIIIDDSVDYGDYIYHIPTEGSWINVTPSGTFLQDSNYIRGLDSVIPQMKVLKTTGIPSDEFIQGTLKPNITELFLHTQNGKVIGSSIKTLESISSMMYRNIDKAITLKDFSLSFNSANTNVEYKVFQIERDNTTIKGANIDRTFVENGVRREIFHVNECFNTTIDYVTSYSPQMTIKPYTWDNQSFEGYIFRFTSSTNILLKNVFATTKHNDEDSSSYYGTWGSMGGNFYKNLVIENSHLSRLDSHNVVNNILVKDSNIDWVQVIGSGKLRFENTVFHSSKQHKMIGFYAATPYACQWLGDLEVIDCTFKPTGNIKYNDLLYLVDPSNYDLSNKLTDYLPFISLTIRNLTIDLKDHTDKDKLGIRLVNLPKNSEGQNVFLPRNIDVDTIKFRNNENVLLPTIQFESSNAAYNLSGDTYYNIKNCKFISKYINDVITPYQATVMKNSYIYGTGRLLLNYEKCHFPAFVNVVREGNVKVVVENSEVNTIHLTSDNLSNNCNVIFKGSEINLKALSNQYIVQTIPNESWEKLYFVDCYFEPYQISSGDIRSLNTLFVGGVVNNSNRFKNCYTDDLLFDENDQTYYASYSEKLKGV